MISLRKILELFGLALKSDLDYVYKQRNIAALAFAKSIQQAMAELSVWKSAKNKDLPFDVSIYIDDNEDWDDDWRTIVQITNRFTGRQISWHMDPEAAKVVKTCFDFRKEEEWDGTDFSKTYEFLGHK